MADGRLTLLFGRLSLASLTHILFVSLAPMSLYAQPHRVSVSVMRSASNPLKHGYL